MTRRMKMMRTHGVESMIKERKKLSGMHFWSYGVGITKMDGNFKMSRHCNTAKTILHCFF